MSTIRALPAAEPGFLGPGHTAVEIIGANDLSATDPFVLLMDDRIDFPAGHKIGDAHPHAGLETVTLVLEGGLVDREEGALGPGDLVWMTAGRGIVHSEHVHATGAPTRILQLWIALPSHARQAAPRLDVLPAATAPVVHGAGSTVRVYSHPRPHVPVTIADLRLEPGARFREHLAPGHNGFLLPLEGELRLADQPLRTGHIAWLDDHVDLTADSSARVLLYTGARNNQSTLQRGPFVAGSPAELNQQYAAFRAGLFTPASQLSR